MMGLRSKLRATKPDDIEFTLEMTMTLAGWRVLRKQLSDAYPSWQLSGEIGDMVSKAERHFAPDPENLKP